MTWIGTVWEKKLTAIIEISYYNSLKKNWVFATNSNVLISISLQPDGVNL